jgi:hypothetical protein
MLLSGIHVYGILYTEQKNALVIYLLKNSTINVNKSNINIFLVKLHLVYQL